MNNLKINYDKMMKFLKNTAFLNDKDVILVKKDGDYTYFLLDIMYHFNIIINAFKTTC